MAARRRWVWVDGRGLVEVDPDWRPTPRAFYIQGDHHEPFYSHADGKYYDSKSRYRAELKARGYEEVACSVESRIQSEIEYATPKPNVPMDQINHICEQAGVDWSKGIKP